MNNLQLYSAIRHALIGEGASIVSCADLSSLPANVRHEMPVGICIGVVLESSVVKELINGPNERYAEEYKRKNRLLNELSHFCSEIIKKTGYHAEPQNASIDRYDKYTLSTPLPHKTVATLSGVGWIGKNACLVTKAYGSGVRLNSVLTNAPLPVADPILSSDCGDCKCCLEVCPADAVVGNLWQQGMSRNSLFDAHLCRKTVRSLAKKAGISQTVCGICIAACPYTKRYVDSCTL